VGITLQHIADDILKQYYDASLSGREMAECEKHLVKCDTCRSGFAVFVRLLDANVSADEASILDKAEAELPSSTPAGHGRTAFNPFVKLTVIAASLVLAAGVAWLLFFAPEAGQNRSAASGRTLEARLSGQAYSEFVHTRTGTSPETGRQAGQGGLGGITGDHHEIGKFYLEHNNVAEAVVNLEMAEAAAPNSFEIHSDLGVAYMESPGDFALQKAIGEFQRALDLNSRYEPARFNLALAFERAGKFSEAEEQLQQYLQLDAGSAWAKEIRSKLQFLKR
jgi:tetratricopeptide (TPR) repeat protein